MERPRPGWSNKPLPYKKHSIKPSFFQVWLLLKVLWYTSDVITFSGKFIVSKFFIQWLFICSTVVALFAGAYSARATIFNSLRAANRWAADSSVVTMAAGPDGTVYVGGNFVSIIDGTLTTLSAVAPVDLTTGGPGMAVYPSLSNLEAVASDNAGGWFMSLAGGYVNGSSTSRYLIRVLNDGTIDPAFAPIVTSTVKTIVVQSSTVYIGGSFLYVNNTPRTRLAALDFSGNLLSWAPSVNNIVYTIAFDPSGATTSVFVGGQFSTTSAANRSRAAAFDLNGNLTNWAPVVTSTSGSPTLYNIVFAPTGSNTSTIFLAGLFTSVNSSTRGSLAAVDLNGNLTNWAPNTDSASSFFQRNIAVTTNTVYLGSAFNEVRSTNTLVTSTHRRFAAIDYNGDVIESWIFNSIFSPNSILVGTNTMYAIFGGNAEVRSSHIPSTTIPGIFGVDADANLVMVADISQSAGGAAAALSGNTLMTGPYMRGFAPILRTYLAAFDTSGNLTSWAPELNNSVNTLLVTSNAVYVGGTFTSSTGGAVRDRLAAFDFNGNLLPWAPKVNNTVKTLALSADGTTIYAGGDFTTTSDANRSRLAAFDLDGNTLPWDPGASSTVETIVVAPSSITTSIFIGGSFTKVANFTRNRLAAVDTNGLLNNNWNPNMGNTVLTMAFDGAGSTSSIFVGGNFTTANTSTARNRLAAIDMNGRATQWNPNSSITVNRIVVTTSSVFLAINSSASATVASTARSGGAEVNKTTGALKGWNPNVGISGQIYTILFANNRAFIGTNFFTNYWGGSVWFGFGQYDVHTVGFNSSTLSVPETVGSVTVSFTMNATSTATTTFDYDATGGSAVNGVDYSFTSGTVSFLPGATTSSFALTINDNAVYSGDKTIIFSLSNGTEAFYTTSTFTVTIVEDEVASPTLAGGYSAPLVSAEESVTITTSTLPAVVPPVSSETIAIPVDIHSDTPTTLVIKIITSTPPVVTPALPKIVFDFKRTLKVGSRGSDVMLLQQALNYLGFTIEKTGPGSVGHETYYFGEATKRAVTRFQEAYAAVILKPFKLLKGTGVVATLTQKKLLQLQW